MMKFLTEFAMIFFGTLMAAGLVALGVPEAGTRSAAKAQPAIDAASDVLVSTRIAAPQVGAARSQP